MGAPLLRFRSDEQLVALFRAGHDEAFQAIHDRYHKRLFAYARQMLPGRQDAEDALQDVFVRAYAGLRASDHELALRAWLFRVAHNRCIDELRRAVPPPPEVLQLVRSNIHDPLAEVDLRESLRRLIADIRRLPEQQRSALLMRELGGMSYADLATSLGISVGAVKSLLVRARVALAQAAEARDTSCVVIREQLVEAHDRGIRPGATARKHMRDCVGCKSFRRELRGMSRQLAAVSPAVGPLGLLAKLGLSGGAGGGAAGGGGLALLGGGAASAGGVAVGVNHVAALLVAAMATAGGAVEIQHTIISPANHSALAGTPARHRHHGAGGPASAIQAIAGDVEATVSSAPKLAATATAPVTKTADTSLQDPLGGGPVDAPATGSSTTTQVSRTKAGVKSTGAAGLQSSSTKTATSGACSTPTGSDSAAASTASSAGTTSGGGTASASASASPAPGAAATTATQVSCLTPTAPATATGSTTSSSGSTTSASQTGGTSSGTTSNGSGASSSSGSAPASGSSSPSSSSSTGSSAGSASTTSK